MRRRYANTPHLNPLPQGERRALKTCVSAKRTHFKLSLLSLDQFCLQKLTSFAAASANGFVLEKRTHFECGFGGG
jgi:hypothetical protein